VGIALRVIAGSAKGLALAAPPGRRTRPTADRVREAIFNRLAGRVVDAAVLDLFAGSGALGIEALSRGAARAVFVEVDRRALAALSENLARSRLAGQAAVLPLSVPRALARLVQAGERFDLIFADPPYRLSWGARLLADAHLQALLAPGGVLVLEHERGAALGAWQPTQRARYGDTEVSLFEEVERASPVPGNL
jgi:16S rRNA (guanine966-N2)-methyltransferase